MALLRGTDSALAVAVAQRPRYSPNLFSVANTDPLYTCASLSPGFRRTGFAEWNRELDFATVWISYTQVALLKSHVPHHLRPLGCFGMKQSQDVPAMIHRLIQASGPCSPPQIHSQYGSQTPLCGYSLRSCLQVSSILAQLREMCGSKYNSPSRRRFFL
jgi:hypothetical protein